MRRFLTLLETRWAAPIFLAPFLLMWAVHHHLGLSDALLAADEPGTRPAHGYNLLLGVNMNLSGVFALLHLLTASQRQFSWIAAKLAIAIGLLAVGLLTL